MKAYVKGELPGTYLPPTRAKRVDENPHNAFFSGTTINPRQKIPVHKTWSATDEERLKKMWANGMLVADIARAFRCTVPAAAGKIRRMQITGEMGKRGHYYRNSPAQGGKP